MSRSGRVASINVSGGGVPKRAVPSAAVTRDGVAGDAQRNLGFHGGPERAVSLFSAEVIARLHDVEGHPIVPGAAGENVTLEGLDWALVAPGTRLAFEGGVTLEVASYCSPCATIAGAFAGGRSDRISQRKHPGESRVYARVLVEGTLREGESVRLEIGEGIPGLQGPRRPQG